MWEEDMWRRDLMCCVAPVTLEVALETVAL
jgi:hypothetical protein